MVNNKPHSMSKVAFFLICILLISLIPKQINAYYDVDIPKQTQISVPEQTSGLVTFQPALVENSEKRYIIFGPGPISDIAQSADNMIYELNSGHGSFAVGIFNPNEISNLKLDGYNVIEDLPLEFDSAQTNAPAPSDVSRVGDILGSYKVIQQYNYTGNGIKIGIVDTGTDFSNPDVRSSLARDENNIPIMIDADGQGLVLTNATFVANIGNNGIIQNYTKPIPKNITSSVYVNSNGVFLDLNREGQGTYIPVYNSQYPKGGAPVVNGTVSNDYKIGKDSRHFIVSKSGMYHFGMIYESVTQDKLSILQLVPVLVVDSKTPGVYDTIIPDMYDSYQDFLRLENTVSSPKYGFDFTTQTPITLGSGNEFLVYDKNHDGNPIYSAGTVGARVLDLYGVIAKSAEIDKKIGAINGTLLPPLDPHGNFFGIMYDYGGHGTATAASITSQGKQQYDIYGNSTKYVIRGIAPGAKIVPIKALWVGDAIYGWLWAAGFDQNDNHWKFSGKPRVDILSNSWGISSFPALESVPGLDIQSLLLSALNVPGSLDEKYPGILTVSSSGNAGPGYGTIGTPDAAPFGLTVGAATDNIFVGYGPFKDQPRFGNSTVYYGDISGFSSKGPSLIGDPKPDIMAIGEYSFTPTSVTKYSKNSTGSFSLFGGTSLASPLVAGSAAIVMQALRDKGISYNPFMVRNILMSTATDLGNDPFAQGSGLVNVTSAVNYVLGNDNTFAVYNNATFSNVRKVLEPAISSTNSTFGLDTFQLGNTSFPETPWFAGRLYPGDRTTATFTIENPTDNKIEVTVEPQKLDLMKISQYNGTTEPRLQDSLIKKQGVYRPDYVPLAQITNHTNLLSFFQKQSPIPRDASLMILDLTFPFSEFMNSSAKTYADDMKISSLYIYDWDNKHNDTQPTSQELSLVNRGGSWGTVQEVRISDPNSKFEHTPLVGVYPVPTRYSYWSGDTKKNSTSIDYTITASYYKKIQWNDVWLDSNNMEIKPHSQDAMSATLVVPSDKKAGVYQGFISFRDESHIVNVPVSYVVLKKLQPKDLPTVIQGSNGNPLFGNGYVGGGFDMSNRYNAGDWREYYFDIADKTINTATMIFSWKDPDTNLSIFVIDPQGRIIQTNVPAGILGPFQGWPSGDWLGPSTPFSEGGGFYPVKNKDATSTEVYAPINQTGVYSVLIHTTLFGGESVVEPITMAAKFSTILPSENAPQINLEIPQFINNTYKVMPTIIGQNIQYEKYYLDSSEPKILDETAFPAVIENLSEGSHDLKIVVSDTVGHVVSKDFKFVVDDTSPIITFKSPANGSTVSGIINVNLSVDDTNLLEKNWLAVNLPGQAVFDNDTIQYDTRTLQNGLYYIEAIAKDKAGNISDEKIAINVNNSIINTSFVLGKSDQNFITLIEILAVITIAALISVITFKKFGFSRRT